tara:strand:- start:370 stop:1302 length:933 start_codon:yes stop_codon:yes gene_type:complete
MKKFKTTLILSILSVYIFAQDTLQHFNLDNITPVIEAYTCNQGYYTGHNSYGDEEFAEKYEFIGTTDIVGVIAIHQGIAGTSSINASYKIYTVGGNGLPGTELANKNIAYNNIPVDGTPNTVMFTNPVSINGNFFVSFNLGDYIHNNPGTKSIALTHSPNGTRPSSDFSVFGRNAIRWHNGNHNGTTIWKDYRTENFPGYQPAIYFSLFPILQLNSTTSVVLGNQKGNVGSIYPNPSSCGKFNLPITSRYGGKVNITLFDLEGKIVSRKQITITAGKTNYLYSDNKIIPDTYIVLIKTPEGTIAQQLIIN